MVQTDPCFFENLEATKDDCENQGFEKCRVDKRLALEVFGEVKILGNQHNFAEGQRIDQSQSLCHKRNMVLSQNDRLIKHEQSENQPEVARDCQEFFQLMIDFLLYRRLGSFHVASSNECTREHKAIEPARPWRTRLSPTCMAEFSITKARCPTRTTAPELTAPSAAPPAPA